MGAGFWDDQQGAQAVINEANALKDMVGKFRQLDETFENLEITHELLKEEYDEDLHEELESEVKGLIQEMNEYELQLLLSDPYDKNNAILELHPVLVEQSHKTGALCYYVCTHVGLKTWI